MTADLLDTPPLRDQRTMVGVTHASGAHRTIADVEAAWHAWATRNGLTVRRRAGDFTTDLRESETLVPVHVSAGKWIADCPLCRGGIAAWPFHERGACLDCGTIFRLDYPTREEIAELVPLLAARPELERNYFPHRGEDLEFVRREQEVYRYPDAGGGGRVVVELDGLRDALSAKAYRELQEAGIVPR